MMEISPTRDISGETMDAQLKQAHVPATTQVVVR